MSVSLSKISSFAAVIAFAICGFVLGAQPASSAGPDNGACAKDDPICLGATSGSQYRSDVGSRRSLTADAGAEGYIWIGNLVGNDAITSARLSTAEGNIVSLTKLVPNQQYKLAANLDLRGDLPKNDNLYFKGQKLVGLLQSGRTVILLANPVSIQRPAGLQLWAKIRVAD